jgi:hypothetical protein
MFGIFEFSPFFATVGRVRGGGGLGTHINYIGPIATPIHRLQGSEGLAGRCVSCSLATLKILLTSPSSMHRIVLTARAGIVDLSIH